MESDRLGSITKTDVQYVKGKARQNSLALNAIDITTARDE
jgi:hypothetical protein